MVIGEVFNAPFPVVLSILKLIEPVIFGKLSFTLFLDKVDNVGNISYYIDVISKTKRYVIKRLNKSVFNKS